MSDPYGLGLTPDMLLGKPTIHVPLNLIVQHVEDDMVAGVFQSSAGRSLMMDSQLTHQLLIADAFIRPQLVFESDHLQGSGFANLAKCGFADHDAWLNLGKLLFDRRK